MATLAFGGIVFGLAYELEFTGGPLGMLRIAPISIFAHKFLSPQAKFLAIWAVTAIVAIAILSLLRSRIGRALAAIRDDEVVAAALGINVAWYKISIFVIAGTLRDGRRTLWKLSGRHHAEPVSTG